MSKWVRDTAFGHTVRLFSGNRVFQYPEERDTELWKRYVRQNTKPATISDSSREPSTESIPKHDDPEKASEPMIVDYFPDDPEVRHID